MERRYQNALRLLNENVNIHPENKAKILEFITHCKAKELHPLTPARKILTRMGNIDVEAS